LNFSILKRYPTLIILLLSFLIRLPISLSAYQETLNAASIYESRIVNNSDALDYVRLAENVIEHGEYSTRETAPFEPELKRVPGYPMFLAALYVLAGGQHSTFLILGSNLLLSVLNVFLIILIGKELFSPKIAYLAGIIYALAPISISLINEAMSETLFTSLVLLSSYFVLRWKLDTVFQLIIGGLTLGVLLAITTYVRAIATYILPIYLLYWILRTFSLKKAILVLISSFSIFIVLLFPWYLRNYNSFGIYTFSTVSDGNLLTYNAASVYAQENGVSLRAAKNYMNQSLADYLAEHPDVDGNNPAVLAAIKRHLSMDVILANPLFSVWVHIKDSVNTFRPGYSQINLVFFDPDVSYGNNVGTGSLPDISELSLVQLSVFAYTTVYYVLIYTGAVLGILILLWQKDWLKLLLLFALPYWFAVVPSIAGNSRFRVPIEGFMAILMCFGYIVLWEKLSKVYKNRQAKR
jgi:4-amino-4-deoxy-L-arabinose transferase-like glycosyltransferase